MKNSTYAWRESYVHAVLEIDQNLRFVQICEAIAAIEQRRLSPVEADHERNELARADEGIQALIAEYDETRSSLRTTLN